MAKRTKVPAALHAELTEYSSMLRALRTTDTLDLAAHLMEPPPFASSRLVVEDDVSMIDDDDEVDNATTGPPQTESSSRDLPSEQSSARSQLSSQTRKRKSGKTKQRDTWTRWPLLAGDVHVPEWGLMDEVKLIAEHVLATSEGQDPILHDKDVAAPDPTCEPTTTVTSPSVASDDGEEENTHPALSPASLRALTAESSAFLARVLALLVAHVPAAEKSMQNRIRPICWETVVDVALTNGVISTRSVACQYKLIRADGWSSASPTPSASACFACIHLASPTVSMRCS